MSRTLQKSICDSLGERDTATEGAHVFMKSGDTPVASGVHTDTSATTGVVLLGSLAYTFAVPLFDGTHYGGKTKADSALNALLSGDGIDGEPIIIDADKVVTVVLVAVSVVVSVVV